MRGITLTELIISLVIVSMMMLGIFAANHAILSIDKSENNNSSLLLRTQAIANMISADAAFVIGTRNDKGIRIDSTNNFLCFRYQDNPSVLWHCYTITNKILERCIVTTINPQNCLLGGYPTTVVGRLFSDFSSATFDITTGVFNMDITNREDPLSPVSATNREATIHISAYPEGHSL